MDGEEIDALIASGIAEELPRILARTCSKHRYHPTLPTRSRP
jgi:hypothetical protein